MTHRDLHVVPMRHWHVRDVHAIDAKVYPRPWSMSLLRQEIALRDSRFYVVAELGGRVVGHAGMMFIDGDGHITTVAVDPPYQHRGIANRLMLVLCRHAHERRTPALTLEVRVGNDRAVSLYRRFGFVPAGVRKNYYTESNEDALIMWAHGVDQPAYLARLETIDDEVADRLGVVSEPDGRN